MKRLCALSLACLLAAPAVFAAGTKTYQVTGPVLDVKDDMVVVQKGKEKWEIYAWAMRKIMSEASKKPLIEAPVR